MGLAHIKKTLFRNRPGPYTKKQSASVLISSWNYLWLKIIKHCVGSLSSGDEVGTRAGNGQFPATRRSVQALITNSLHNIYRYYL